MSKLEIRNITNRCVGPIDLTIEPGTCVCIHGPSGAGKTLLLRAIADLDPHGGEALLDGTPSESFSPPEWRKRVGLLPTESRWWERTVGEHYLNGENHWLSQLGLASDVLAWDVNRLSTGERQRLALGRLLENRPQVLLLDEPTASLDSENTERVEELLNNYRLENEAAVLWVTHEAAQASRVSARSFTLVNGQVRKDHLE